MIHPRDFARLHPPDLHALIDEIHAYGMHSIHYFCGNPAGKLDMLLSTRLDALGLEESKKGYEIDIAEVADLTIGRCAMLGNLDAIWLLPEASEEELSAELKRQAEAGRRNGGRFVFSLLSLYTVRARFTSATLLSVEIKTGRTHQIRVHLSHIGHPVLGDHVYGGVKAMKTNGIDVPRQMLHAESLSILHPDTGHPMTCTAPPPEDMAEIIGRLGQMQQP